MNIGIIDLGINNIKSVKDFFSLFGKTYILNNDNDLKPNTKLVVNTSFLSDKVWFGPKSSHPRRQVHCCTGSP